MRSSSEGAKYVAAGMNPMDLKRGIDMAVERRRRGHCKKRSKKIKDSSEEVAQVGTIVSPNGDHRDWQDDRRGDEERSAMKA
jgi:chaperonin GroEL